MQYDLLGTRNSYGLTKKEFAKHAGISPVHYSKYEERGEIPSKYIYNLWTNLKNFPIPDDFFYYTSKTLVVNMSVYRISQKQVSKALNISSQVAISNYINSNCPMYEKKELFNELFKPLIVPFELHEGKDKGSKLIPMTKLEPKGRLDEGYSLMAKKRADKRRENLLNKSS